MAASVRGRPGSQLRGNRGCECASGSVGVVGFHALAGEWRNYLAIEQHIDGAFHVAALDDHGVRAHLHNFSGGRFHVGDVFDRQAGENFSFGNVGRDHGRAFQKFSGDKFYSRGVEQFRAAG